MEILQGKYRGAEENKAEKRRIGVIMGKYYNDLANVLGVGRTHTYRVWMGIIKRCEGKSTSSYNGTSICEEWRTYSNFKQWYESQKAEDGWQIDKDFLSKDGNKIYSPDTCIMIPGYVNSISGMRTKEFQNKLSIPGVTPIYESVKGKGTLYVVCVLEFSRTNKDYQLKTRGKDPLELHKWYQENKAIQIEKCRDYYATERYADTRVLEKLTEMSWTLRLDKAKGRVSQKI